jgi:hypothetical protein
MAAAAATPPVPARPSVTGNLTLWSPVQTVRDPKTGATKPGAGAKAPASTAPTFLAKKKAAEAAALAAKAAAEAAAAEAEGESEAAPDDSDLPF